MPLLTRELHGGVVIQIGVQLARRPVSIGNLVLRSLPRRFAICIKVGF